MSKILSDAIVEDVLSSVTIIYQKIEKLRKNLMNYTKKLAIFAILLSALMK